MSDILNPNTMKEFYKYIFDKHAKTELVPSNVDIAKWAIRLIRLIFPEQAVNPIKSFDEVENAFEQIRKDLLFLLDNTHACKDCDHNLIADEFMDFIPELHRLLKTDIAAMLLGDPAANSEFEIIRSYPGFYAISFYRIANKLFRLKTPVIPRILTEYAHSKTGIDIHPGATIGENLYIDHGTGLVIGESAHIGNNVKLYQGITLGALSVEKDMAGTKRHPTVEDNVVIYSGATILGGETVIGKNSIIGGNVWLTKSVPADSIVYHLSSVQVAEKNKKQ
ncbi:Serine O-acetyltransferase [Pseudopedobacter saltans DSM 12145]|uniref:Serine O-acetyltransferase n=2 Tax=Pseudopedobacter saltans TaxID=151895 RepID=F0S5M6_PSESL|nr:Serine O-acetyltransferase [Pseudopedobacter saltans DSM 12145]